MSSTVTTEKTPKELVSKKRNLQNDLLHLFSPLQSLSPRLVMYPDYTIETPIGFFRLAYSEETHTSALFYSRHADNLSATENDLEEIAHKDFLYLVAMREHHHSPSAKWNADDQRLHMDMTWAQATISDLLYRLPRTLLREATLHKVSDVYISTFAAYEPYDNEKGTGKNVRITTKAGEKYNFINYQNPAPKKGALRWIAQKLSADFNLAAKAGTGSTKPIYTFRDNDVVEAILADFHARLLLIWKGVDPVAWGEVPVAPMLPFSRMADMFISKARETEEEAKRDPEAIIRALAENVVHLIVGGPLGWLETQVIRRSSELGEMEKMGITPEWKPIGDRHIKRFPTVTSNLHRLLTQPDPAHFKDLRWLTPHKHHLNFEKDAIHAVPTRERIFSIWVQSQLRAPYASVFQYLGTEGPAQPQNTKLILTSSSSGVQVYYIPGSKNIYAYYNVPDNKIAERKLNYDADDFFDQGSVLKLSLDDPSLPIEKIRFVDFKSELEAKTGLRNIPFPKSQEPPETLLSPDPAQPADPAP